MKNKHIVIFITICLFSLSLRTYSQNYFEYNGSADVNFRYQPRGSGGRALVHDSGNILSINYGGDFTGGVRIWRSLSVKNGNNYFNYNGGADVTLRYANRGSGGRALVHDSNNILSLNHGGDFTGGTFIGGSKVVIKYGNVGIRTTDTKGFELGVLGKIVAEEVKVAKYANWADFVFENDYHLPTLKEVEEHIKEKGHLKDIPSAEEIKKDGFFLGEMNAKLLQKIEELTLYTIEQQKKIDELSLLKEENKLLHKKFDSLETLVSKIIENNKN